MSLQSDPLSGLAPIAANSGIDREALAPRRGRCDRAVAAGRRRRGGRRRCRRRLRLDRGRRPRTRADGSRTRSTVSSSSSGSDEDGRHREQVPVHQQDGRVEVGTGDHTVASDASSVMLNGQAWTTLGGAHGEAAVRAHAWQVRRRPHRGARSSQAARRRVTRPHATAMSSSACTCTRTRVSCCGVRCSTRTATSCAPSRSCGCRSATGDAPTSSTSAPKPGPRPVDDFDRPYHDPASAGDGFRLDRALAARRRSRAALLHGRRALRVRVRAARPSRLEHVARRRCRCGSERPRCAALRAARSAKRGCSSAAVSCTRASATRRRTNLPSLADDVSQPDESRVERLAKMVVDPFRW